VNRHAIWAITRKDLATVMRNKGVRTPLLVAPFIILVMLPTLLVMGGEVLAMGGEVPIEDLAATPFQQLGEQSVQEQVTGGGLSPTARWAVFVLEVFIAPLYLLVPLIVATVIAADSFAGERERGTLEALLHTPTTDRELLTGKFLAAWLPAIVVAWSGFAVYSLLANALAWPSLGRIFFPSPTWLLLAFWVTPAISALGLGVMVIASSRVQSLQAAHQVGSLVVLPVVLLLIVQITGTLLFSPELVLVMGALIWIAAGVTVYAGAGSLKRQALAVRI
jgi:ABC-2 type transport system permease protein